MHVPISKMKDNVPKTIIFANAFNKFISMRAQNTITQKWHVAKK